MKKLIIPLLFIGLLESNYNLYSFANISQVPNKELNTSVAKDSLQNLNLEAFTILNTKCNVCHKKKNRSKIFSMKNMDRYAPKVYKQVFVKKRMPKGKRIKLTDQEYQTLKNWLESKNIK